MNFISLLIFLLSAYSVASNECNILLSPNSYVAPSISTHIINNTRNLFTHKHFHDNSFIKLNYGPPSTVFNHVDWLINHTLHYTTSNTHFQNIQTSHGVKYEINQLMTRQGFGAGYFRLSANINVSAQLFAAIMFDAQSLAQIDNTVLIMDFLYNFSDIISPISNEHQKTFLSYYRADGGRIVGHIDGLDITAWRRTAPSEIVQVSVSVPYEIDMMEDASRAVTLHWGYRLTNVENPDEVGYKAQLKLISQVEIHSYFVPKWLANKIIGGVLADYVRTAEEKALEYVKSGKDKTLLEKYGFNT